MKKNVIVVSLLVVNILCVLVILLQHASIKEENLHNFNDLYYRQEQKFSQQFNGATFDINHLIRNVNDSVLTIKDVMKNRRIIVFRYSFIHCNSCVDTIMKLVDSFAKEVGKDKILILSQYANYRDYRNYVRINRIKLPIYDIRDTILADCIIDKPYMFVLDDDMVCNNFYVPHKEAPDLVNQYLQMVKRIIQ